MSAPLVRAATAVTLVGGGPIDAAELAAALALAPTAVAADSGGDVALPEGTGLAAVIGDLDSLRSRDALRARGVPVHAVADQDTTDLEKCLAAIAAPLILGIGFLQGRVDHQLAAMNALVRWPQTPAILLGGGDVCFRCPDELALDLPAGTRVSLFPMGPATGRVSEGLRWSIAGLRLAPDGRIGTSNAAAGGRMRVGFDAASVIVILPAETLPAVAARLGADPR